MSLRCGIIGFGVTGKALGIWLTQHTSHQVYAKDPALHLNHPMDGINVAFICVPADTDKEGVQDLSIVKQCVSEIPAGVPIFVRTTVLPGTCRRLSIKFKRPVYAMPEFLTERQAYKDMCDLPVICGGGADILERVFCGQKKILEMENEEAELAKYTHNGFAAVKVNFFNIIRKICDSVGIDYQIVLDGASQTKFIEPTHTQVPGHDGKFGFGGKCLPKDLRAFASYAEQYKSLAHVLKENDDFRDQTAEPFAWATHVGEA